MTGARREVKRIGGGSATFEVRLPFLEERGDAFLVVLAIIDFAADGLDEFEGFGGERVAAREEAELFFEGADGERGVCEDFGGEGEGEREDVFGGDEVVEDAEGEAILGVDGVGGEEHFFGFVDTDEVDEVDEARRVVGDADFCGSHGKRCGGVADEDIAREGEVAGTAPDATLDHGDDSTGVFLGTAEESFERAVVGERVAARLGEFADIVAGRPDFGIIGSADNDDKDARFFKVIEGFEDFFHERFAQAVAFRFVGEGDGAEFSVFFGRDEVGHSG